jgi:histidyl-tRNA synthetase
MEAVEKLGNILNIKGGAKEKLSGMKELLTSEHGVKGLAELEQVFGFLEALSIREEVEFDLTLARGLNYYTGTIFEVKAKDVAIGSICGGGRYDNLTGIFGMDGVSGVGISFGADRIYDVLEGLGGFPEGLSATTNILLINFGPEEEKYCLKILEQLRKEGISSELYPESDKIKKQMKYADQKGIPFVVLIGESEMKTGLLAVKEMKSGNQESLTVHALVEKFKNPRQE